MKFYKRCKHDTDCAHDGRVKKFMLQDKLCQDSKYCKNYYYYGWDGGFVTNVPMYCVMGANKYK